METFRYQLIKRFCELSGNTEKAVRRKIEDGVWREGREYRRAPDGRIYVDGMGVQKWIEQGRAA